MTTPTLYCRVPDTETGLALLHAAGFEVPVDDEDNVEQRNYFTRGGALVDVIGPVVTTPAEYGADGEVLKPAVMDARIHFNVYHYTDAIADVLADYTLPAPATPLRVLA